MLAGEPQARKPEADENQLLDVLSMVEAASYRFCA